MGREQDELRARWKRDGLFPAGSPIRRIAWAPNAIPAAGRMVLLELAHPAIARTVDDFDQFRDDPIRRGRVTAEALGNIIHGTVEEADAVGQRLAVVHGRVRGPGYSASDPELVLWVAATYFDSLLAFAEMFGRSVARSDETVLYEQMVRVIELLGCPRAHQPASIDDFREYVALTVAGLEVTEPGLRLARAIFWPSSNWRHNAPMGAYRVLSFGMLPAPLREQFGYRWTPSRDRSLRAFRVAAPALRPIIELVLSRLADGKGRPVAMLMSVAGYEPARDLPPASGTR